MGEKESVEESIELNEYNTGNITTVRSNLNTGSLVSGVSWIAGSGTLGNAISLNGTTGYVDFGTYTPNVNTVSFWLNLASYDSGATVYCGSDAFSSSQWAWGAFINSSNLAFLSEPPGAEVTEINPPLNEWHHYCMIRSVAAENGSMFVYKDGALIGSSEHTNNVSGTLRIGKAGTVFPTLSVDELILYSRELSVAEVGSLSQGRRVDGGILNYYKMNEGTGSYIYDYSQGTFSSFTPSLNGAIKSIQFEKNNNFETGSLLVLVSGTGELVYSRASGLTSFVTYPSVYGFTNQCDPGSPWANFDIIVNNPLQLIGSDVGGETVINNIKIKYQ